MKNGGKENSYIDFLRFPCYINFTESRKRGGQNDKYDADKIKSRFVRRISAFSYGYMIAFDFITGDFLIYFYERGSKMNEIITIQISKFLTDELAREIAKKQWKTDAPLWVNRSRQYIFDELMNGNDCFGVVATASDHTVIGRLHCVRNETDPRLWYYGDLFVVPEYRRLGIASRMIRAALDHLSELGADRLRCYVEPENTASRNLQVSVGFSEKVFETFNDFINDGEIMYEAQVPNNLTVIPATENEAYFVRSLFAQNKEILHAEDIGFNEWRELLSLNDCDEKHFMICKGALPVGYLKINGLDSEDEAWISMLFIAKNFQRQGIGTFAITYAEKYAKQRGFRCLAVQTDEDNLPAQNFYLKCGYRVCEKGNKIELRKIL